jgi:hypothetical protein
MRSVVFASFAMLVAACGATEGSTGALTPEERSSLAADLTETFCSAIGSCCQAAAFAYDPQACAARVRPRYERFVGRQVGHVLFHAERVAACKQTISTLLAACRPHSLSNVGRNVLLPDACVALFEVQIPRDACASNEDCAPGQCVYQGRGAPAYCQGGDQGGLEGYEGDCGAGMRVDGDVCVIPEAAGGIAEGVRCVSDGPLPFLFGTCAPGLYCDDGTRLCAPMKAPGEPCGNGSFQSQPVRPECGLEGRCPLDAPRACVAAPRVLSDEITPGTCAEGPVVPHT